MGGGWSVDQYWGNEWMLICWIRVARLLRMNVLQPLCGMFAIWFRGTFIANASIDLPTINTRLDAVNGI